MREHVAQHARARAERDRTAHAHDGAAHLAGDLDPPVEHDDVAADDPGDRDRPVQDDDLADLLAAPDLHVTRQRRSGHAVRLLPVAARTAPRQDAAERQGRDREQEREHRDGHAASPASYRRADPGGPRLSAASRYGEAVSLEGFSPAVRAWFESRRSRRPPPRRRRAGRRSPAGSTRLILAPTGSGKTLAAFLWALDRLMTEPPPPTDRRCRVLYVSPLRALAVDIEKNLRAPLAGIGLAAERLGEHVHEPRVAMRTGDTPANERRRIQTRPPDILITTPESLYLMLTSQARELLRSVRWVIVDEIHAMAGTKRGAHLALSLERLEAIAHDAAAADRPVGDPASARGDRAVPRRADASGPRPVTIVDAGLRKPMELEVVVPVEDMAELSDVAETPQRMPRWTVPRTPGTRAASGVDLAGDPPRLLELIRAHRSTIVFVNARRLAERLAARLNELAGEELARAHHGSIAREQRLEIEDRLKRGTLKAIVATSSLELGIDMGAVDLVIQVESPGSVARGLQRIGRAGHQVGEPSRGKVFPKYRGDLLEATVVVQRMLAGGDRGDALPAEPARRARAADRRDVRDRRVERRRTWRRVLRVPRTSPSCRTTCCATSSTCSPAGTRRTSSPSSGRGSCGTGGRDTLRAREGAGRLAIASGGTIPDRGLFGVFTVDGRRVGELDEEMVYESRRGEVFVLGATSWRIEDITLDRVVVSPAPGEPGKMPFWHGDRPGRPLELGRAIGAATRELASSEPHEPGRRRLRDGVRPRRARRREPRGVPRGPARGDRRGPRRPDDRRRAVPRRDRRLARVRPVAVRRARARAVGDGDRGPARPSGTGSTSRCCGATTASRSACPSPRSGSRSRTCCSTPTRSRSSSSRGCPGTTLFTTTFREAAARALLLPRRTPGRRTPLWQQRQRGADLLDGRLASPDVPDPARGHARVPARRVRRAGAQGGAGRRPSPAHPRWSRSTRRGRRRSRSRCCSAGSRSTCTRTTRRWPSAAPPRSRSTASCCASCSAPRTSAS